MIEKFKEIFDNRYSIAKARKDVGQKIMGWVCTFVPEEIVHAAGMFPFRVVGGENTETPLANAYLYSNNCTFSRQCLEEGLNKGLDFLDGFVTSNSCDHIRRLFDVWLTYIPTPYKRVLSVPCKVSESSITHFWEELITLKEELEEIAGSKIGEDKLWESIDLYNETRRLLMKLYEFRKKEQPPISGREVAEIVRAAWYLPREEYNDLLNKTLTWIDSREPVLNNDSVRVMIVGSELDDPEYMAIIEELGGAVVADDLCSGSRYFWTPVEKDGDPLRALATRYLSRPFCARMHPATQRMAHLRKVAQEYNVDAVIMEVIKFCDIHGGVYPLIRDSFKEIDIPVLYLEREYILSGIGQMKTRVEAFFEGLAEGKVVV
jgi:bzd-type benzoyl-CoA reductase N subunit